MHGNDGDPFLIPALHQRLDVATAKTARRVELVAHLPKLGKGELDNVAPVVFGGHRAPRFLAARPVQIVRGKNTFELVQELWRQNLFSLGFHDASSLVNDRDRLRFPVRDGERDLLNVVFDDLHLVQA